MVDLEFTPVPPGSPECLMSEVIEIGAVRMSPEGEALDEFRCVVCPEYATSIAPHVRRLTGLRWIDVCDAPGFAQALAEFSAWIGDEPARLVAWSDSDRIQIQEECEAKNLEIPANMRRWLDLQRVFPRMLEVGRRHRLMSLQKAQEWYGVDVKKSSMHTALRDAQLTADLLSLLLTGEHKEQKKALHTACAPAPASEGRGQFALAFAALAASLEEK